jgi:hypothetical protein
MRTTSLQRWPQDLNPYAYADDNPATESDPTGDSPITSTELTTAESLLCQQAIQSQLPDAIAAACGQASGENAASSGANYPPPPPVCPPQPTGKPGTCISEEYSSPLYVQPLPYSCHGTGETYVRTVKIEPYVVGIGNENGSYEDPNTWGTGNTSLNYWAYNEYAFNTASEYSECVNGDAMDVYYGQNQIVRNFTGFFSCAADSDGHGDCNAAGTVCTSWRKSDWENSNQQQPTEGNPRILGLVTLAALWPGAVQCSGPTAVNSGGMPVIISGG